MADLPPEELIERAEQKKQRSNRRELLRLATTLYIAGVVGVFLTFIGVIDLVRAYQNVNHDRTEATVTDVRVEPYRPDDSEESGRWNLVVQYVFEVDGESKPGLMYYPRRVMLAGPIFGKFTYWNEVKAQRFAQGFAVGDIHTVCYAPDNPRDSSLLTAYERQFTRNAWTELIGGLVISILSFSAFGFVRFRFKEAWRKR